MRSRHDHRGKQLQSKAEVKKKREKKRKRHTNKQKKGTKKPPQGSPPTSEWSKRKGANEESQYQEERESYLGGRVFETKKMEKARISTCSRWSPSSRGWLGGEISKLWVSFPLTSWQKPSLGLGFFFFRFFFFSFPLPLSRVTCPWCSSCDSSQSPRGTRPLGLWKRCRRDRGRINAWLIWPDWFLREIRGKLPFLSL